MAKRKKCPSKTTLRLFNDARLADADIEIVANHLDECEACLNMLEHFEPGGLEKGIFNAHLSEDSDYDSRSIDETVQRVLKEIAPSYASVADPTAGSTRYEMVATIAKDNFCTTYLAREIDDPTKQYFLKIPLEEFMLLLEHRSQFVEDSFAAFQLDHPNILNVVHFGIWDEKTPFLLSETSEHPSLVGWLSEGKQLDFITMLAIYGQVAGAIQHAHESMTLHRCLTPAQIFVAPDGSVKVWNFGICNDGRYQFDLIQSLAGATEFDSPEVARNNPVFVNEKSDIYSLGVLLGWMLERTAKVPESTQTKLDEVSRKCKQKRRSSRFANVLELVDAVAKATRS